MSELETDAVDQEAAQEALEQLRNLEESGMFAGNQGLLAQLRRFAAAGVSPFEVLRSFQRRPAEEPPLDPVLSSFDLEGFASYLAEKSCSRVIVMCGAGISTSAGIPDFRTPGTGLYDNLQRFNLPRAESIFELDFFRENPGAFYELARDMWPGNYSPTPAHYFIRLLHEKGILLRCYSQNIDSLERAAGLPSEKLVAAHGNFDAAHVIGTSPEVEVNIQELKSAIDKGEEGWKALQTKYGNLVKPKIVFFGEDLPPQFTSNYSRDLQSCDLLIVLGTSLVVHPFASLVGMTPSQVPRLLINRDPAGTYDVLSRGFRFNHKDKQNWRDVFCKGDCDSGCRDLASLLGWRADLDALIESKGSAQVPRAPWASESKEVEPQAHSHDAAL